MRIRILTPRRLAAATLALASLAGWTAPARAENSSGDGTKQLVAGVPREGTGYSNGPTKLLSAGEGKYRMEYTAIPAGSGIGMPGGARIDSADGKPMVVHGASGR